MKIAIRQIFLFTALLLPFFSDAAIRAGVAKTDMTPPIGTPSAGYADRKGEGMAGVHDPLLAIALYIDNGEKQLVFCSVDHLGYPYEMAQEVIRQVKLRENFQNCEIFISSSHSHSASGAYLDLPHIGEMLAGKYDEAIKNFTIEKTVEAIVSASENLKPAKVGIGYGLADHLSYYRSSWPKEINPLDEVALIKVTTLDDVPIAALFNYPVHPTLLKAENRLFSADLAGCARVELQKLLGSDVQPLFINGAQGDVAPVIFDEHDRFHSCELTGASLAKTVEAIWQKTKANDTLEIKTEKQSYSFAPKETPFGIKMPVESYQSEMNAFVLNRENAFITIPGELSTVYDDALKQYAKKLGFQHCSIFGLTNDAHGYILLPESWRHKTGESALSFGGENYGEEIKNRAESLLKAIGTTP